MKFTLTMLVLSLILITSATSKAKSTKMAEALYFEARGEPRRCQIMVANVIMNRVADHRWPSTVYDVINQPAQFSYMSDGKPETITDTAAYYELLKISNDVIDGKLKDLTGGANHYLNHNTATDTHKWFETMELKAHCGNHWFYKA